jgi:ferredoxin--NADP+ reductase
MNTAARQEVGSARPTEFPIPAGVYAERVVSVRHYTDRLFSFRITRPQAFRFRSGEFVMIGLPNAEKPVFRAYSIASPAWDEEIEFFSIKVPDGPLTQHLQKIQPGDTVLMRQKSTGTLVLDALTPAKRLWMISTGTGIAPFASLMRDPETYDKFEQVILTHTCRDVAELVYGNDLARGLIEDPLIGELAAGRFTHYATTTRENHPRMGRITTLIEKRTALHRS